MMIAGSSCRSSAACTSYGPESFAANRALANRAGSSQLYRNVFSESYCSAAGVIGYVGALWSWPAFLDTGNEAGGFRYL